MHLFRISSSFLNLLGLEHNIQEGTQEPNYSESTSNQRTHTSDELIQVLALADNCH